MRAQHRVDRLEHVAHARFRDRALDHDNKLGLVRGRAHEPPGAVLDRDPHTVDDDEIADRLPGDLAAVLLLRLEMRDKLVDPTVFPLVRARRRPGLVSTRLWKSVLDV